MLKVNEDPDNRKSVFFKTFSAIFFRDVFFFEQTFRKRCDVFGGIFLTTLMQPEKFKNFVS
jgi:hypothetical protein